MLKEKVINKKVSKVYSYNDVLNWIRFGLNNKLINFNNKVLYVTVFNEDFASCPGYGQDTFPITYAINIKKGKIIWKQEVKYKNQSTI